MNRSFRGSFLVVALLLVAGCGSGGPPAGGTSGGTSTQGTAGTVGPETTPAGGGGGGGASSAKGYDCATLLMPTELDAAAGLQGGTVKTVKRGDQPSAGEVPGVTECGIEFPNAGVWAGSFHVYTGDEALGNFGSVWDIAQQGGAVSLAGVGGDALISSTEMAGVHGYARGVSVGIDVGVAWDDQTTTEQAVKDAVKQILATVLPRT